MGDKTRLLALMLAARFQRPLLVLFGIFVATLANHTLAGVVGACVRHARERDATLTGRAGVFTLTAIAFFRRDR